MLKSNRQTFLDAARLPSDQYGMSANGFLPSAAVKTLARNVVKWRVAVGHSVRASQRRWRERI